MIPSDNFIKLGEKYNTDTITKGRAKNKLAERQIIIQVGCRCGKNSESGAWMTEVLKIMN